MLETMEDEQIANSHTPIEEIPQTDKPSENSSSKIFKILKLIQEKNSNHRPQAKLISDHKHVKTNAQLMALY